MAEQLLRLTILKNPYIEKYEGKLPSVPQAYFLTAPVDEILYGGAAGGGKSAGLLASALQYVQHPGYDALILRRTFADLAKPGALIPLSKQWLAGTDARYNEQTHQWTFPSGATLSFGHVVSESAVYDYQGSAFAFIGFDELTQFTRSMYDYLTTRLRKMAGLPFPTRMRATSNPGGVGHEWVKSKFIDSADGVSTLFVPARLEDNPGLDRDDYERSLSKVDHVTRAQLRHGDWDIRPDGALFRREWFLGKVVDSAPRDLVRRVRFWDLAATEAGAGKDPDYTASVLMGLGRDGDFYVLDADEFRETPAVRDRLIRATAEMDGRGVEVFVEQEPGSGGKHQVDHLKREVLRGYVVRSVRSTGSKVARARPFSAACENGLVKLVRGKWVKSFVDRLMGFGLKGVHDDIPDAAAGSHSALAREEEDWTQEDVSDAFDGDGIPLDATPSDPAFGRRNRGRPGTFDDAEPL